GAHRVADELQADRAMDHKRRVAEQGGFGADARHRAALVDVPTGREDADHRGLRSLGRENVCMVVPPAGCAIRVTLPRRGRISTASRVYPYLTWPPHPVDGRSRAVRWREKQRP